MVSLVEQGWADQNDVARAFGCSERTLRRHQRRFEDGGLTALGHGRGFPRGRRRLRTSRTRWIHRLKVEGNRISRSGIAYILHRAVVRAQLQPKNIPNRHVTPHTLRHTTAMELLRSGVDLTVIAAWLGHSQLTTTHQYLEIDLRMKQAAIAASATFLAQPEQSFYPDPSLLAWLDRLGRGQDYVQRSTSKSLGPADH